MIKQISIDYLKNAFDIFDDVKKDMIKNNIDQWDEIYPSFKIIENDIINHHGYGYFDNEQLIGYITVNEIFSEEYNVIDWKFHDDKPLIIHRLAVKSKFQDMGIAKKLMRFVETKAKNDGHVAIRLDAFSGNPKSVGFYERLGYSSAGQVYFRKGLFYCFEKNI